ncbi:hypothetical protein EV702DRAFT_1104148 [Suillus placidus]|uniref:Uncharacterized protein n=1 Tax=Suillus placidus TaxID=48579 RepID=A0A9P6ZW19_9AGAM|nr:hypothetical protein EV702DRAFT_1104148 [Suillus placidus]
MKHSIFLLILVLGAVVQSLRIVAISAQPKYSINAVDEYIVKRIPIPVRDFASSPRLIRSFDTPSSGSSKTYRATMRIPNYATTA